MNSYWLHFGWAIISFPSFCSFVIQYLIYSLRPIGVEGEEWGGAAGWWAGLVAYDFQHPGQPPVSCLWTAGRRVFKLKYFSKKASISRSTSPRQRAALTVCCPAVSSMVELCFFWPERGVKPPFNCIVSASSGWFLPLLVFPVFRKQHAVKVQSGLTASKNPDLVHRLCPDVGFCCKPGSGLHFRLRGKDEVDDQWPSVHALTWHICICNADCNPHIRLTQTHSFEFCRQQLDSRMRCLCDFLNCT